MSRYNLNDLPRIAETVKGMGAVLWSVFFLVPTGRGMTKDMITPEEHEQVMIWLANLQREMPYGIKATEAPHYRRVFMQQQRRIAASVEGGSATPKRKDVLGRSPKGVNDGDGFVFISHIGEVYPSGFLPVNCGNVRDTSLVEIYRNSPILQQLRDKSLLKGKCGACEFKELCGGSRARAYAVTGDYLESDPYCSYIPRGYNSHDQP
ncbi:pyrroloquinoline quinone biosynthesis protein PqqE [compost metagenome]